MSNQTHVSQSGPDANIVSIPGTYRKLAHKIHYTADTESWIITGCNATTGCMHEVTVLPERLDYQVDRLGAPVQEIIADRGYSMSYLYPFAS